MIYVTIDLSRDPEEWHLRVLERLTRGIKGLERDGFTVNRYNEFASPAEAKWLLTISRPESGEALGI